ncbi:MAG: PaaI family thioesterase [Proteobacteria bacterium]|nr:PaaI family thioesterase [Pseudomonadota bacterium]
MALTLEQMNNWLALGPFNAFCRLRVIEADLDAQTLVMVMPIREEFERIPASRQWHGGPIACLVDTAGCFAVSMVQGHAVPTVNFRVDYFRPAIQTDLTAKATVRRVGKSVAAADVDVFNDKGQLLAVGRATFSSAAG